MIVQGFSAKLNFGVGQHAIQYSMTMLTEPSHPAMKGNDTGNISSGLGRYDKLWSSYLFLTGHQTHTCRGTSGYICE